MKFMENAKYSEARKIFMLSEKRLEICFRSLEIKPPNSLLELLNCTLGPPNQEFDGGLVLVYFHQLHME